MAGATGTPVHSGQRHSGGTAASTGKPAHTPWCHVPQPSHCTEKSSASTGPVYAERSRQLCRQGTSSSSMANSEMSAT